jgi:hypothetical protein
MAEIHEGGCLCGDIRYRVSGDPTGTFVCHCTFCQRASGSAFQIPVYFPKENVEFIGGPINTYDHRFKDHGRTLRMQFCPRCSTKVGWTIERDPGLQGICGGTFDDPNWFKVFAHIFTDSAVGWMTFPPGVRVYDKHFITEAGTPETPYPRQARPWMKSDLQSSP